VPLHGMSLHVLVTASATPLAITAINITIPSIIANLRIYILLP
jgi:hypothetical protein